MFSRGMLWFIGAAFAGVLIVAWWAGGYPAHLTLINTSGRTLENIAITTGSRQLAIDRLADGEFRKVSLPPGDRLTIRCGSAAWESDDRITPAQSVVVYVLPGPRFEARSKIGTLSR